MGCSLNAFRHVELQPRIVLTGNRKGSEPAAGHDQAFDFTPANPSSERGATHRREHDNHAVGAEASIARPGLPRAIQQKLDRLDDAFLFAETIDRTSYERQRDRLREELTLAQIDHHAEAVDELDVQGILAFAERILPRASDLWVQASLD
jgi:hypothetical protein